MQSIATACTPAQAARAAVESRLEDFQLTHLLFGHFFVLTGECERRHRADDSHQPALHIRVLEAMLFAWPTSWAVLTVTLIT